MKVGRTGNAPGCLGNTLASTTLKPPHTPHPEARVEHRIWVPVRADRTCPARVVAPRLQAKGFALLGLGTGSGGRGDGAVDAGVDFRPGLEGGGI